MINTQINIFILIALGWFLARKGILDPDFTGRLNTLVMNLLLPANILHSFQTGISLQILVSSGLILLISCLIQAGMILLSKIIWKNEKEKARRISLEYATAANNAGTLGMVISQAAFGDQGVLFSAIYMIPVRVVMWSYGLALYAGYDKSSGSAAGQSGRKSIWSLVFHPCLCAVYLGIGLMGMSWMGAELPAWLQMPLDALAACSTPMILMVIGSILSSVPFSALKDRQIVIYSLVRLVVLPALVWLACLPFGLPVLVIGICTLESAMPAPVTMGLLASKYDCDPQFASGLIFLSTFLSMITLPLWTLLFQ